jgi:hypothetical protein
MENRVEDTGHVTIDGRRVISARELLRDPKVKQTIERLSKLNRAFARRPGQAGNGHAADSTE